MTTGHDVQVGDVWRLNMGSICATYLMIAKDGELWTVHHLEYDEVDTFYDIWFARLHPDYDRWEKLV